MPEAMDLGARRTDTVGKRPQQTPGSVAVASVFEGRCTRAGAQQSYTGPLQADAMQQMATGIASTGLPAYSLLKQSCSRAYHAHYRCLQHEAESAAVLPPAADPRVLQDLHSAQTTARLYEAQVKDLLANLKKADKNWERAEAVRAPGLGMLERICACPVACLDAVGCGGYSHPPVGHLARGHVAHKTVNGEQCAGI